MKNVKANIMQSVWQIYLVGSVDSKKESCFLENVIKIENFSSLEKLFRVTCYVLRFVKNLLAKLQSDKKMLFPLMKCQK